jgi:anti-sigma B factor antagonist
MHWTEIQTRTVGDVVLVDLRGRVTITDESALASDTIRELVRQGRTKILVNLVHVPYIDSLGVGDIVRGFIAAERAGGTLKLCGVAGRVRAVLDAIQLSGVIESFESEQDALCSFSAPVEGD